MVKILAKYFPNYDTLYTSDADPDPAPYHQAKIVRKTLIPTV
jgi:hypothetical protein